MSEIRLDHHKFIACDGIFRDDNPVRVPHRRFGKDNPPSTLSLHGAFSAHSSHTGHARFSGLCLRRAISVSIRPWVEFLLGTGTVNRPASLPTVPARRGLNRAASSGYFQYGGATSACGLLVLQGTYLLLTCVLPLWKGRIQQNSHNPESGKRSATAAPSTVILPTPSPETAY